MELKKLTIAQGETPPADTPQELKNLFSNPSFWRELDKEYYKDNPDEQAEEEWYASYDIYGPILEGERDFHLRKKQKGETIKDGIIWDGPLMIWMVNKWVNISTDFPKGRGESVVGKIKLIRIEEGDEEDRLIFAREGEGAAMKNLRPKEPDLFITPKRKLPLVERLKVFFGY